MKRDMAIALSFAGMVVTFATAFGCPPPWCFLGFIAFVGSVLIFATVVDA